MSGSVNIFMHGEKGSALIAALAFVVLSVLVTGSILSRVAFHTKTSYDMKQRDVYFYDAEDSLGRAMGWLHDNGNNLAPAFVGATFDSLFDRGSFSVGDNDSEPNAVSTRVKLKGTNSSFLLAVPASLGESASPAIPSRTGSTSFLPIDSFESSELGPNQVRLTLVDAVPVN